MYFLFFPALFFYYDFKLILLFNKSRRCLSWFALHPFTRHCGVEGAREPKCVYNKKRKGIKSESRERERRWRSFYLLFYLNFSLRFTVFQFSISIESTEVDFLSLFLHKSAKSEIDRNWKNKINFSFLCACSIFLFFSTSLSPFNHC